MSYFLAIDAGGTKTQCLLADETRVLARATTGTVKLMRIGEAEATAQLKAMLAEVAATAGVSLDQVTRTCFGLAGISSPAVRAWADKSIAELVGGELLLCGDEEIALDAAFDGGVGILVVAGTGSNAIGRSVTGEIFGAGGWGPVLGDEGSGTWIGLEAIRTALRTRDRERLGELNRGQTAIGSTSLLLEIERHWKLNSLSELVAYANRHGDATHPAPDFASLAPVVARLAAAGDALAAKVLALAGVELAELVSLVFRKMTSTTLGAPSMTVSSGVPGERSLLDGVRSSWVGSTIDIAFTGGVLTHIAPVRAAMTARLTAALPTAHVRQAPVDPLDGALWRARRS
jgi:N-acetylglucosamine kinase-like BadF-type ATPase